MMKKIVLLVASCGWFVDPKMDIASLHTQLMKASEQNDQEEVKRIDALITEHMGTSMISVFLSSAVHL